MRALLLAAAFAAVSAIPPVPAQELQVTLTGTTCPLNGCQSQTGTGGTFTVSFDLDTISDLQNFTFGNAQGVECVSAFSAADIALSNFSASVNGRTLSLPSATTAQVGMTLNDGACAANRYKISIQAGHFTWTQFGGGTAISAGQFESSGDPFESMLLGNYVPAGGSGGAGSLLPDWAIAGTMRVTQVPEPGAWGLLLAGLLGSACVQRARRRSLQPGAPRA